MYLQFICGYLCADMKAWCSRKGKGSNVSFLIGKEGHQDEEIVNLFRSISMGHQGNDLGQFR